MGSACEGSASHEDIQMLKDDGYTARGGKEDVCSDNKANLSEGTLSLLYISRTDDEDTQKATACKAMQKSDTQYGAWQDKLMHQGRDNIAPWDKMSHDYAEVRKPSKAPNSIGPPLTYMEVFRAFKPLTTTSNPLGMCQFYCADPASVSSVPLQNLLLPSVTLNTCQER